jgi:hypothetical protein
MTDRFYALTVILEKDIREDDAQYIIDAIKMIKGVLTIKGEISDSVTCMAEVRAKIYLKNKLLETLE